MIGIDIWRAANEMIRMFGEDASMRAAMRADTLLDQGDSEGFSVWRQIALAIDDLSRDKPRGSERTH